VAWVFARQSVSVVVPKLPLATVVAISIRQVNVLASRNPTLRTMAPRRLLKTLPAANASAFAVVLLSNFAM
jgi:hypothetical protein